MTDWRELRKSEEKKVATAKADEEETENQQNAQVNQN